jgi:hypothetical protein
MHSATVTLSDDGRWTMTRRQRPVKLDLSRLERGFTIREPHIQMILTGDKEEEYRIWKLPAQYMNVPIALHAAATNDVREAFDAYEDDGITINRAKLVHSAIVAVITFAGCETLSGTELFAWPISHVVPLPKPIPCTGQLGFWFLPAPVKRKVIAALQ